MEIIAPAKGLGLDFFYDTKRVKNLANQEKLVRKLKK